MQKMAHLSYKKFETLQLCTNFIVFFNNQFLNYLSGVFKTAAGNDIHTR